MVSYELLKISRKTFFDVQLEVSVSAYCFDKLQNGFAKFMTGMI